MTPPAPRRGRRERSVHIDTRHPESPTYEFSHRLLPLSPELGANVVEVPADDADRLQRGAHLPPHPGVPLLGQRVEGLEGQPRRLDVASNRLLEGLGGEGLVMRGAGGFGTRV
jgi:hypothetical protein